ncbi:MAG: hypothetical protein ACI8QS_003033 [Planctomycetota bacterium]|jgi:hypothetical protein
MTRPRFMAAILVIVAILQFTIQVGRYPSRAEAAMPTVLAVVPTTRVPVAQFKSTLLQTGEVATLEHANAPLALTQSRTTTQRATEANEPILPSWAEQDNRTEGWQRDWLKQARLPTGSRLALQHGRKGPPDPVAEGLASLRMNLSGGSGVPLTSEVILWRIDAPANRFWTRGDQDIARVAVGPAGYLFDDLEPGYYRPVVLGERQSARHQGVIRVEGDTDVELLVQQPGKRSALLQLMTGEHLSPTVEASFGPLTAIDHSRDVPPWANPRQIQNEFQGIDYHATYGEPDSGLSDEWHWLYPLNDLYDLRDLPEDTRGAHFYRVVELRFDGRVPQKLAVESLRENGGYGLRQLIIALMP